MNNWKILLALTAIVLAGCQQTDDNQAAVTGGPTATNTIPVVEEVGGYGKPFSNGPTSTPESMTGPTTSPPGVSSAQAVTTNENIRLTLPRKTE